MFGVLAIDKPAEMTSRDVVNHIQRMCRPHKVGHTGTLDPLATGVLLLAVGPATRLVEFSHEQRKAYQAEFLWGCRSETLDIHGELTELAEAAVPTRQQLLRAMQRWIGEVEQIPPKYSAVHVQGRRAYELARQGAEFEVPVRQVQINSIHLIRFDYPLVTLAIECGSGTYIRSLGSDLARDLDSDAVMTRLVRTAIGCVRLEHCIELASLRSLDDLQARLLPPQTLVSHLPRAILQPDACEQIRHGIPLEREAVEPVNSGNRFTSANQTSFAKSGHAPVSSGPTPLAPTSNPADLSSPPPSSSPTSKRRVVAEDDRGRLVAILVENDRGHYRSLRVFHNTHATNQPSSNNAPHKPES